MSSGRAARLPPPGGSGRHPLALEKMLRLMVITDVGLAYPRAVEDVVEASLEAGARTVQLREKNASGRDLAARARKLRDLTRRWNALLIINDRFDLALAVGADGVHLGPGDLPVEAVRSVAPPGFIIGHSTDVVEVAQEAEKKGADYIGCGAVYPTSTKEDAGSAIGVEGLDRVARAVGIPVLGIGGITVEGSRSIARRTRAAGIAVIGAVMKAPDPGMAVRTLLEPFLEKGD